MICALFGFLVAGCINSKDSYKTLLLNRILGKEGETNPRMDTCIDAKKAKIKKNNQ